MRHLPAPIHPPPYTLRTWRALCEWLDGRPRKAAYCNHYLLTRTYRAQRRYVHLVFFSRGWGWRLYSGWRERLVALENEIGAQIPLPMPGGEEVFKAKALKFKRRAKSK